MAWHKLMISIQWSIWIGHFFLAAPFQIYISVRRIRVHSSDIKDVFKLRIFKVMLSSGNEENNEF